MGLRLFFVFCGRFGPENSLRCVPFRGLHLFLGPANLNRLFTQQPWFTRRSRPGA